MLRAGLRFCGGFALLHTAVSSVGILNAAIGKRECWNDRMTPPPSASWQPTERDAHVQRVSALMYSGAGLDGSLCSDDVTFEDPAALCCGREEAVEAFRALRALAPEHVTPPQVCYSAAGGCVVLLHQRYLSSLVVRSELHVQLNDSGLICAFEERWNGRLLLEGGVFDAMRAARRLNGVLSFAVTRTAVA